VNSNTKIYVLEPESSPMISKGWAAEHYVEGVGIGFVPPFLDAELYDEAWGVCEHEGRKMCRLLAEQEGILAGTSTGLNVVAAIELARTLGPGKTVVTVASDTGLKYMAGGLSTSIQNIENIMRCTKAWSRIIATASSSVPLRAMKAWSISMIASRWSAAQNSTTD
jgi:threonine synthase